MKKAVSSFYHSIWDIYTFWNFLLCSEVIDDDDDDDDVIILPNEEPSVTEIIDDEDEVQKKSSQGEITAAKSEKNENVNPNEDVLLTEKHASSSPLKEFIDTDVEIQEPAIPFTDLDTYVEKKQAKLDESSQSSTLNVRVKEEPKDDDEEDDDGFEDVGTVVVNLDDEISIESSGMCTV